MYKKPKINKSVKSKKLADYRKTNILLFSNDIFKKYWSKIVLITTYLQNYMSPTKRDITHWKGKIGFQSLIIHCYHINKQKYI